MRFHQMICPPTPPSVASPPRADANVDPKVLAAVERLGGKVTIADVLGPRLMAVATRIRGSPDGVLTRDNCTPGNGQPRRSSPSPPPRRPFGPPLGAPGQRRPRASASPPPATSCEISRTSPPAPPLGDPFMGAGGPHACQHHHLNIGDRGCASAHIPPTPIAPHAMVLR